MQFYNVTTLQLPFNIVAPASIKTLAYVMFEVASLRVAIMERYTFEKKTQTTHISFEIFLSPLAFAFSLILVLSAFFFFLTVCCFHCAVFMSLFELLNIFGCVSVLTVYIINP